MQKILISILVLMLSLPALANEGLFQDFDGNPRNMDTFTSSGSWLVLMIWAHDCRICDEEVGSFEQYHLKTDTKAFQVVGLSLDGMDGKSKALGFIRRHKLTFPNLIGELTEVMSYYRSMTHSMFVGTPSILLFSPQGEIKAVQVGPASPEAIEKFVSKNSSQ